MANLLNFRLTLDDLLGPRLADLARRAADFGRDVERPHKVKVDTSQAGGALKSLTSMVAGLGLGFAALTAGKEIVKMGTDMEQTRIQFETFTGSAEKGNQAIAKLQKFAQVTPFDDAQVIQAGRGLLAFGENVDSLEPQLSKLGNISAATGKDFNELVSLWGKNKLSGIIQGDDLNQLNDSGIPVMESLARQLGVNVSQVRKMGEQGKITFAMLDKSFDELGGPAGKWGNLMEKQSQTIAGRWSSLVGFAQNMGSQLGEAINPFLGKVLDGGNALLTFISENKEGMRQMFGPLVDAMQPLFDAFANIRQQLFGNADAGSILAGVFNGIGTVLRILAPFIKIAAGLLGSVWVRIVALVVAVSKFVETSPRLQKFFAGLWQGAVATFKAIADAASKFLGGVGDIIEGVLTMNWSKLKSGLSSTLNALGDTQKVGEKAADGFVSGYKKGFKGTNLFGAAKAATGGGEDAASEFTAKGSAAAGKTDKALTAGLSKAATGGSVGGGGKVTNITLRIDTLMREVKLSGSTMGETVQDLARQIRDTVIAELNDVNTLSSAN